MKDLKTLSQENTMTKILKAIVRELGYNLIIEREGSKLTNWYIIK